MLSNDYAMSAKVLMHPKSVFRHYLRAPLVVNKGSVEEPENCSWNYVNHELEFVGSMAGTRVT